ncbi:MAG TPA: hypothetical protein VF988_00465 [Verrucomicrobiae bacterium]
MTDAIEPNKKVIRVGPDQVTITDAEVVIEAKHEMPEWEVVRSARPPSIYFEDKRYLLIEKEKAQRPYAFRYVLKPWPPGKESNPNMFFDYNLEAVAERDGGVKGESTATATWCLLLPLYPFLGFFWSGVQERLGRLGFLPRSLTGVSIFMSFCFAFAQAVMASILLNASGRTGHMTIGGIIVGMTGCNSVPLGSFNFPVGILDILLFVALVADAAMRFTHYQRDDQWHGGFLEWIFRKPSRSF